MTQAEDHELAVRNYEAKRRERRKVYTTPLITEDNISRIFNILIITQTYTFGVVINRNIMLTCNLLINE